MCHLSDIVAANATLFHLSDIGGAGSGIQWVAEIGVEARPHE